MSGFDYGSEVLRFAAGGSSATEARDPGLKRGPGKGAGREGPAQCGLACQRDMCTG